MTTVKRILTALVITLTALGATAQNITPQIPAGYYSSLNGLKNADLKNAIFRLVRNFTQVSSYSALPQYFQKTDVYPESMQWWDMYSDIPLYAPSFKGLNREHSFPKSWWGGSTEVPCYVDLNHLYPSEAAANMAKSNFPLGTVDPSRTPSFSNGITTVGYPVAGQGGGAASVFEPDDEYKGDFARTYFYMATAYQDMTWKYTYMVSQNTYPTLNNWSVELLLKWHRQDPVSDKEVMRNQQVYLIQNNRNPFIDYPELAELLWGDKKGLPFDASTSVAPVGDPNLITPVQDMTLDFGQVAIGKSTTSRLFFKGQYLTSPIKVQVYRDDAAMFKAASAQIAANLVNSDDGYWLNITYTPTALGSHTSRLLISGGGTSGSRGIELLGQCLEVPSLTAPVATAATGVTEKGYTANWTPAPGETVDYYIVTRTVYQGTQATTTEVLAEENSLEINDFAPGTTEAYSVQSVRLGYRSPASNVINVQYGGVTNIENNLPLAIHPVPGALRIICSQPHTDLRVYDATGRLIATLPQVTTNTDIPLAPGLYLITTRQHPRALQAIVSR